MADIITEYPRFFTATNLEWKKLLIHDKYKNIVIESLRFLVNEKRVIVYGFVIMDNHIHEPLSVEIWSEKVLLQKLKYMYENPVRAGLCKYSDDYKYSSAIFYKYGKNN